MVEQDLVIASGEAGSGGLAGQHPGAFGRFKRMLMREKRTLNQRLLLALCFAAIFGASVATRVVTGIPTRRSTSGWRQPAGGHSGRLRDRPGLRRPDLPARHVQRRVPDDAAAGRGRRAGRPAARLRARIPRRSGASRPSRSQHLASSSEARTTGARPFSSSFCWRSSWRNSCGRRWAAFSRDQVFYLARRTGRRTRWPSCSST